MSIRDSKTVTLQTEEYEALLKVLEGARLLTVGGRLGDEVQASIEAYDNLFRK